ncbi:hypothetical protein NLM27_40295 [Bradyrhizobium sp. CCGB12]|uniref:hypothetical protein n=1 Tax=Bradyrhizobium sp. CCGB12 TaxID=2949632 RepID=UPI0020B412D2|nr:hypothetical protein [Bradyrhizobium sp. CCGB12]MCP3394993.1 hypothetical protein [Bradyrhizobium sp. CCGB12]
MTGLILMLMGTTIILFSLWLKPPLTANRQFWGAPTEGAADIAARYPGPIALRQPPWRFVALTLGSLFGVAAGYRMTVTGQGATVLWGSSLMSAFCAFVAIKGFPVLTLDATGFELRSRLRTVRLNWHDVTRFYCVRFMSLGGKNNFVRYEATPGQPWLMLGGFNISAEELAELMTLWRAQALRQKSPLFIRGQPLNNLEIT